MRHDAKEYLNPLDGGFRIQGNNFEKISLPKIWSKLSKNKAYRKKR